MYQARTKVEVFVCVSSTIKGGGLFVYQAHIKVKGLFVYKAHTQVGYFVFVSSTHTNRGLCLCIKHTQR